jgi:hypothetical protein
MLTTLEFFGPRAQFNVRCPCAAMLAVQLQISLRDCVRVEAAIGTARCKTLGAAGRLANAAVNDDLRDMDILRLKLARHALY